MFLEIVLGVMILILLIPIYTASRNNNVWEIMLAFSSVATKTSVMILLISILRDDWMLGLVGVIILSVGNSGFMLLSHILKRVEDS